MLGGGAATAGLITVTGLATASMAQAATDAPGMHASGITVQAPPPGGTGDWSMFLGSQELNGASGGPLAWCFDMGVPAGPSGSGAVGTVNNPVLNYAITKYQGDTSTHPALNYLSHELADPKFNKPWNGIGLAYPDLRDSTDPQLPAVRAQAAAILADAQANAGPYTVNPVLALAADHRTGTVTATELLSAAGNKLTGFSATATLTGPGVFANGSQTINLKTGDTLPFTSTGNGTVKVTITVHAPGTTATSYSVPGFQNLMVANTVQDVAGTSADAPMVFSFQPTATTNAAKYYNVGDTFTDVIHPATSSGNPWMKDLNGNPIPGIYQVDVYQAVPLVGGKTLPTDAKPIGSGTVTTTDGGAVTFTATSGITKAPAAGSYYTVAKFIKANQPANLQQFFTGDWVETDLTNQVSIVKATSTLVTTAIDNHNGTVSDKIKMICDSTDSANTPVTLTPVLNSSASAPVAGGTPTAPADNKVQGTAPAVTVHCGETVTTAPVAIPWASLYKDYWNANPAVLKPTLYFTESGPATGTTNEVKPVYLHPDESIVAEKPAVSTTVSASGKAPLTAHDNFVVTGFVPVGPGISNNVSVPTFKSDDSTDGSAQPICGTAFYTYPDVAVTGPGQGRTIDHTFEFKGTYDNQETLFTTIPGLGKVPMDTGKCGAQSERFIVYTPSDIVPNTVPNVPTAPLANTGDITPHQDMNNVLLVGGLAGLGAIIVALIAIGAARYQKRRVAAMNTGDENNTHADEIV